ncbi:hypothetical protein LB507_000741 [Fusarium sp. FIESC RH6]|nr:hypothetical protein LB507_000741 [Fusarium sp. FIESC RH6]
MISTCLFHWLGHAIVCQKHRHHSCSISLGFTFHRPGVDTVNACSILNAEFPGIAGPLCILDCCTISSNITIACHSIPGSGNLTLGRLLGRRRVKGLTLS